MSVSVVIPVHNPDKRLDVTIDRILRQKYEVDKILLIHTLDFTCDDMDMFRICEKYKDNEIVDIIEIAPTEFDHGGTRHMAMEKCDTDYVLFMTQDAVPKNRSLVGNMVETLDSDEDIAVVYGKQEAYKYCSTIESYTRTFNYADESFVNGYDDIDEKGIKAYFSSDVCAMYRKSLYEEIGGFPTRTILNEDSIYGAKAIHMNKYVAYNADAIVYHSHNYTGVEQFKRNFDIGVSHRQFNYIFDKVKAEGEGLKLVKETASYLIRRREAYLLPYLLYYSACKFLGYRLGKLYTKLPKEVIMSCTSNKGYWKN